MRIQSCSSMNSVSASCSSSNSTLSFTLSANSDSSPHSNSSSSLSVSTTTRCEGLDLLVKAVYYIAGSMVGVPFIQKRVIRRRRRALRFNKLIVTDVFKKEDEEERKEEGEAEAEAEAISMPKRQRRVMALPSKYQDSVLQSWKPRRRRRRSVAIVDGSG